MSRDKGLRYIADIWNYSEDLLAKSDPSALETKDILGFDVPEGANAFLPQAHCVPITSLLPLYDRLIVGIPKISKISHFRDETGLTFDDIVGLANQGRLVLFVDAHCYSCQREMADVVQGFVDNDVPVFFSGPQEVLLALKAAGSGRINVQEGRSIEADYSRLMQSRRIREMTRRLNILAKLAQDMHRTVSIPEFGITELKYPIQIRDSIYPLHICSKIKPTAEYLRNVIETRRRGASAKLVMSLIERLYMVPKLLLAKTLHSTLSTNVNCRFLGSDYEPPKQLRTGSSAKYFDPANLEFVERKLSIAYSDDVPVAEYASLFDSRTTDALRTIVSKLVSERTGIIPLQNALNQYNEAVKELTSRSSRRAKLVYATSDILKANAEAIKMLLEGAAEKYVNAPRKAWDCIALPGSYRRRVINWLRERTIDIESKLVGVSPELIHLYRTRTCLEKLERSSRKLAT